MITIRKDMERGHFDHGWLDTKHTFSFASYYNPEHMGFGPLRVINEDVIKPGKGFGMHQHDNMEIITIVVEGKLEHKDNMGNTSTIKPGEIQKMSAGTGVMHSEYNPSKKETAHILQIWIEPDKQGIKPAYEQKKIEGKSGKLMLIASKSHEKNSVSLHQDMRVFLGSLRKKDEVAHDLVKNQAWIHVIKGQILLNGLAMKSGDGAAANKENILKIRAEADSEILLFDMKK